MITAATQTMLSGVIVDLGKGFVHLAQKLKVQSMTVLFVYCLMPLGSQSNIRSLGIIEDFFKYVIWQKPYWKCILSIHQACHLVEDNAKRSISYKSILHLFYFIAFPYGNPHPIQTGHYNPSYTPSLLST